MEPKIIKYGSESPYRPDWDTYFLKLAMLASERATCPRMHCGCIIARNNRIVTTGYNGSLPGQPHCDQEGCMIVDNHCVRTNHAEMNAICQAARLGLALEGSTAYVTNMPCTNCARALIAAGIVRVVVFAGYKTSLAERFFKNSEVQLDIAKIPGKTIHYDLDEFISAKPLLGSDKGIE
ncbi:MAG: cytidine/deoxycytidylate deaminase family protein [Lentisphaeria bacterium]